MMVLNTRMSRILQELMGAESVLTSEYLASIIQVTSRTIRTAMKELSSLLAKYGADIKSARGTGYELKICDEVLFRRLLQEFFQTEFQQGNVPDLPDERVRYVIKQAPLVGRGIYKARGLGR